jgi:hypothetical protein
MVSAYRAGYVAGRLVTKLAKGYLATRIIDHTVSKAVKVAKHHKIDSKNTQVVSENLFDCLEYLD